MSEARTRTLSFPKSFEPMHIDSFCTADPYRAAFMVYCGLRMVRCVVLQDETMWCEFEVPKFDAEAYDDEWARQRRLQRQRHFRSSLISKKQVEGVIRSRGKWKSRTNDERHDEQHIEGATE